MNALHVDVEVALPAFRLRARFDAPGAGITSIFGPSGSGKTTLLRCVAGLTPPDKGVIRINGATWQDEATFLRPEKRAVGYVFQESNLFSHLRVRDNLRFGYRRVKRADRRIAFDDAVAWLGLENLLDRWPAQLSGGECQRVAIARALLTSPQLLLMDEPLASLDETSRRNIMPYLTRLHETLSIPMLYVSHSIREVARLADYIVELRGGVVVATGTTAEMLPRLDATADPLGEKVAVLEVVVAAYDATYHLTEVASPFGRLYITGAPQGPPLRGVAEGDKGPPLRGVAEGRGVFRVQIAARDVSLAFHPDPDSSLINQLPARVTDITDAAPGQVLVRLAPAGEGSAPARPQLRHDTPREGERPSEPHVDPETHTPSVAPPYLLALITAKSRDHLALTPGKTLYARVKGVSILE